MVGSAGDAHARTMTEQTASTIPSPPPAPEPRRVRRSVADRKIGGVAGGIAEHFDLDPSLVRLGFVAFALFGGSGILFYLIAWIVIPAAVPAPTVPPEVPSTPDSSPPAAATPPADPQPAMADDAQPFTVFPMV